MRIQIWGRRTLTAGLILLLIWLPLLAAGCSKQKTTSENETALAATMVPDVEMDLYLFFKQPERTILSSTLLDIAEDIEIISLAVWGVVEGSEYALGGALIFNQASDAAYTFSLLPEDAELWTELSDRTIYAVYGSGTPFSKLKSAVLEKRFKNYDNRDALKMVAALPGNSDSRPVMLGVLEPNQDVIELVKNNGGSDITETIDDLVKWVKPRLITGALYSDKQIQLKDLDFETLWNIRLGAVLAVNTAYPGLLFEPVAKKYLNNQGYTQSQFGKLKVYETEIAVDDRNLPLLINISGSRIFGVISNDAAYSQSLMGGIAR